MSIWKTTDDEPSGDRIVLVNGDEIAVAIRHPNGRWKYTDAPDLSYSWPLHSDRWCLESDLIEASKQEVEQ